MPLPKIHRPVAPSQNSATTPTNPRSGLSSHHGAHRRGRPATAGASGFDAPRPGAQTQGRAQVQLGSGPQVGSPQTAERGEANRGLANLKPGAGATGTGGAQETQATKSVLSSGQVSALFDKGSKTFETILGKLGYTELPQIEDSTARLAQRSSYLDGILKADPSLVAKIDQGDLAQVTAMARIYADIYDGLDEDGQGAVNLYFAASARMAAWPPPPGNN